MANSQTPARGDSMLTRDFILLFILVLLCNCFLSIYYCFEQWLDKVAVTPSWRGILLGSLFGMVMITRPVASVLLLKQNKLPFIVVSICATSMVMLCYRFLPVESPSFVWMVLALRIIQGFFLAIFSSCTVAIMVSWFPPGQSARGFAIFSLTALFPYSIIPAIGEPALNLLGNEADLFAAVALLGIPSLTITAILAPALRVPEIKTKGRGDDIARVLTNVRHSGLFLVFFASLLFCLTTNTGLFFMKGLCTVTGGNPAYFFTVYTLTMVVIRTAGNTRLDRLPRHRFVPVCSLCMGLGFLAMAWLPLWAYVPASFFYGANLSLVYPLIAAIICDRSEPEARSLNSNFMMTTFDAAGLLAPIIGGEVISAGYGYRGVFTAGAILITTCGLSIALDGVIQRLKKRRTQSA